MNIRKKNIWIWLIPFLIMAITLILFKAVFLLGYVPTGSMEPTLKKTVISLELGFSPNLK